MTPCKQVENAHTITMLNNLWK